jgi:hypothetical protein
VGIVDLKDRLARLSAEDAEKYLNVVLKGLAEEKPSVGSLVSSASEADLVAALRGLAGESGVAFPDLEEPRADPARRAQAVRFVLEQMAADPDLAPRVEAALNSDRARLAVPLIATALVLAAIVIALSVEVEVEVTRKGSQKETRIRVKKKASTDTILGKFLGLFF